MHHLIIGGGPAATNCLETIRRYDSTSQITLISDEPAHSRMAIPYWLAGKIPEGQTHTADAAYYEKFQVDARIGTRVKAIDPTARNVTLDDGSSLAFDRLLVATGSSPVLPPIPGLDLPGVQPLWNLRHVSQVLAYTHHMPQPRVVFVGAGFIGFIVLGAMFKRGWQLTVVEREAQVLPRMLDRQAANQVERWLASQKIPVHVNASVKAISEATDGSKIVELSSGERLNADVVIVATGIKSNLELLAGSGVVVDQGVLVNDQLQSNYPFLYAAGDIAQGPVIGSTRHAVHAIQTTAVDHGRVAGANMAGEEVHYPGSLLMNVVDVCGLQAASYGDFARTDAEAIVIDSPANYVYRKLLCSEGKIVGATFTGRANDLGMLTDLGMVKGFIQTQTYLGPWLDYLRQNPFDVRRAYIGCGVAQKLAEFTLLGKPAQPRQFHFGGVQPGPMKSTSHKLFVQTKTD